MKGWETSNPNPGWSTGLALHSYWVGASDEATEDEFLWLDGTVAKRGTPFWATGAGVQQPNGGTNQNCVALYDVDFFFLYDFDCNELLPVLCEQDG